MRRRFLASKKTLVVWVAALLVSGSAGAGYNSGDDPTLVLPEVLIIIDTSGSMEWGCYGSCCNSVVNGITLKDNIDCDSPNWTTNADEETRWVCSNKDARDNKTIKIPDGPGRRNCNRSIGTTSVPQPCYHQPCRNRVEAAIEVLTGNDTGYDTICGTGQGAGLLDEWKDQIHFGFSSYDNDDYASTWNYPSTGGDTSWGSNPRRLGMKGRNQGNGSLFDLLDPANPNDPGAHSLTLQKDGICKISATGGTPSCAALWDALYYFQNWQTETGFTDAQSDCRKKFVILITDGQENTGCYDGSPYGLSTTRARALYTSSIPNPIEKLFPGKSTGIPVFVVGFGNTDPSLKPALDKVAWNGSGGDDTHGPPTAKYNAFSAEDQDSLRAQLTQIFQQIAPGNVSRTSAASTPSTVVGDNSSYQYKAYFDITTTGIGWIGHLARTQWADTDNDQIPEEDFSAELDFEDILATQSPTASPTNPMSLSSRNIFTVAYDPRSQDVDLDGVINSNDDLARSDIAKWPRRIDVSTSGNGYKTGLYPFFTDYQATTNLMCLPSSGEDVDCSSSTANLTGDAYANYIREYIRGVPNRNSQGTNCSATTRTTGGPLLGDIFHSSPVPVGPPSALTPDLRFEAYYRLAKNRYPMVYAGANDGMLHAFIADKRPDGTGGDQVGKEAWGFIPNNLLAKIQKVRSGHSFFVDSTPVVRDVYFSNMATPDPADSTGATCLKVNNQCLKGAYRTVLIVGQRGGGSAYTALDVTDPLQPRYLWEFRTDVPAGINYNSTDMQCRANRQQTWAEPIIGSVWLKNNTTGANQPLYVSRSVAIVPGGYVPPQQLQSATSCFDFAEMLINSASLFVIDIETGKLLKKFLFNDSGNLGAIQADIDAHYTFMQTNNCYANPDSPACVRNLTPPINWNLPNWSCSESRKAESHDLNIPAGLTNCFTTDTATSYEVRCCDNPSGNDPHNCNLNSNNCYYRYYKDKTVPGGVEVKLKLEGCFLVSDDDERGRFELNVGNNFLIESVSASPAAYNVSQGEFLSRVFVGTNAGKIYRVDLTNAAYNGNGIEGYDCSIAGQVANAMICPYTASSKTYNWSTSVFYDTTVDTNGVIRPISVMPTLALNYNRRLVLYFGSGVIDNLDYPQPVTKDYFWGVEEPQDMVDGYLIPRTVGRKFPTTGNPIAFASAERLFGKPLVMGGKAFFVTYLPSLSGGCGEGASKIWGTSFDNFGEGALEGGVTNTSLATKAPPTPPRVLWTPSGGVQVVVQQGATTQLINTQQAITPAAHILQWGRFL